MAATKPTPFRSRPVRRRPTPFKTRGGLRRAQHPREQAGRAYTWISIRWCSARSSMAVCAYDISNRTSRRKSRPFVPEAPALAPQGTIQLNDVFADERGVVYSSIAMSAACILWRWGFRLVRCHGRALFSPLIPCARDPVFDSGSPLSRGERKTMNDLFRSSRPGCSAAGGAMSAARGFL